MVTLSKPSNGSYDRPPQPVQPPQYGSTADYGLPQDAPTGPSGEPLEATGPDGKVYYFEKPVPPTASEDFDKSFKVQHPIYNDRPFTYVFWASMIGFVVLTWYSYSDLSKHAQQFAALVFDSVDAAADSAAISPLSKTSHKNKMDLIKFALATVGVPVLYALLTLMVAYAFPVFFVFIGYVLVPFSFFSLGVTFFKSGQGFLSLIFNVLGLISLIFLIRNYRKLSFTALMLKIVIKVMRLYPSTILVSFLGSFASSIFGCFFYVMSFVIYADRNLKDSRSCSAKDSQDGKCSASTTTWWTDAFIVFVGCFGYEVIKNLVHVTISGIYGTWYFFEKSAVKPRHPAWGAFKRSVTFSFGSVCYGSLVVAVMQFLEGTIGTIQEKLQEQMQERQEEVQNGGSTEASDLVFCTLSYVLSALQFFVTQAHNMMRWFNQYAFSYIALYGESYFKSAGETYEILKYKGMMIVITDCLLSLTLKLYSWLVAFLSSGTFYFVVSHFQKETKVAPEFLVLGFILQALLAYFIAAVTLNTINSGFITFILALCIKPEVYEQNYHDYFVKLTNYYPEVSRSINVPFPETA